MSVGTGAGWEQAMLVGAQNDSGRHGRGYERRQ